MLSPTATALFHRQMEIERARLNRADPNYVSKLQAILQKQTLVLDHQYSGRPASVRALPPKPIGSEDYGGNTPVPPMLCEQTDEQLTLTAWRSPQDFRDLVQGLHTRYGRREIVNKPRLLFLRDAWTLAEFAFRHDRVDKVRMEEPNEQWPDGYVSMNGETQKVEVTIALPTGRKMGDELRCPEAAGFDSVESWIAKADALPAALEEAINRKIAKKYGSPATLVVYLNISEYGIRHGVCRHAILEMKERYSGSFAGLYVLWKDELF